MENDAERAVSKLFIVRKYRTLKPILWQSVRGEGGRMTDLVVKKIGERYRVLVKGRKLVNFFFQSYPGIISVVKSPEGMEEK